MAVLPRPRRPAAPFWRTGTAIVATIVVVAAVVVAWTSPGFREIPPLPVDRSVWVVNSSQLLVGRINTEIGQLDSATLIRAAADVIQEPETDRPATVLIADQTRHELQVLDTTVVTLGARVTVPEVAEVALTNGTIAVADRADGRLWVGSSATPESVDARLAAPAVTVGAQPAIAISTAGTVFATSPGAGSVWRAVPGEPASAEALTTGPLSVAGSFLPPTSTDSPGQPDDPTGIDGINHGAGNIQITAVGEIAVVLDRADSSIRVGDRRLPLPALPGAVLQWSGPSATEVVLASTHGLVAVGLDDGTIRTLTQAQGAPVAPVVTAGCAYGAWLPLSQAAVGVRAVAACYRASTGSTVLGSAAPTELTRSQDASALTYRRRGDAVVLGDNATGRSWVANDGFRLVDNWFQVTPGDNRINDAATVEDPTTATDLPELPPDCTAVPVGDPRAVDDEFGVRAGRSTVLRVMDNDPSIDCTPIVIDSVSSLPPELGTVAIVDGGSAIQLTVPDTATGQLPAIEYQVGNGKGQTATARVLVGVAPQDRSEAPQRVRRSAVTTEVNGTVTYNVLDDFFSPTGDDVFLLSAVGDDTAVVSFRPDGAITYRNTGNGSGTDAVIRFVVSDGVEQTAGTLTVAIASQGSSTPLVYPVYVRTVLGTDAVATPARNVVSPSDEPVVIRAVQVEPGSEAASARLDERTGTVTVSAVEPGNYYLTFEAAAGGRAVTGVLRVDVTEPTDSPEPVVPMADVAFLQPDGQAVVDPLANDTDPDGQGLSIQELNLPAGSPITAAVVDLHLVRVSAARTATAPVLLDYSVFDGSTTQVGQIRVVPVPARREIPPPLAAPITATVRAGDAVTIPVTRYATSQDGSPVSAELDAGQIAGLPGRAFSTGDTIRYLAPSEPPIAPVSFSYTAVAASSTPLHPVQTVSTVTINVTDAASGAPDSSPGTPPQSVARVFAGGAVSISLPLDGIDPDGDWVVLQTLEPAETPLGDIEITDPDTVSYRAFGESGVDRVRYVAADPAGHQVTGELVVLVTPPGQLARPPMAPDLDVAVRPGARIRIDPLESVVDPGGLPVTLASPAFTAPNGVQVEMEGDSLILTAPAQETVAGLRYAVVNAKGLGASGAVRLTVSDDAPTPSPLARDVFVRPADLAVDQQTVDVDVSASITNRSGRAEELLVAVDPLSAELATVVGPRTIRVTVGAARRIVAYQVVDTDGAKAVALIVVPPRQQLVGPQLIATAGPILIDAGEDIDVDIADYVTVGGGAAPMIASSPPPRISQGTATRLSAGTLALSAPLTAGGQAALYVPIDDSAGTVTVLTIPVLIEPRLVPPPTLDSTAVQIEAGAAITVDLAALTGTADARQAASVGYRVGGSIDRFAARGLQVELQGAELALAVRADIPRGTEFELPLSVVDEGGRTGQATVTVTVTGSTLPLPTVLDQQVTQARAGVEVNVDLLAGSIDPIGLGLTVTGLVVTEGAIVGELSRDGSNVRLLPAAGNPGDIVLTAEIADGTKDPERVVRAVVRISVQDRPSAPGSPAIVPGTLTARSVQLVWSPAEPNGAPVVGYTVSGSGVQQDCPGAESSCLITGLLPGQSYQLTVTARNAVGESAPSAPSTPIVPDATPTAPAAPSATYVASSQLSVAFAVPTGDFTPVTAMSLRITRGEDVVQVLENVSSPVPLSGLDPAAGYRFAVQASNEQGPGEWSADSVTVRPSGVPGAPTALSARFVSDDTRRGIEITWAPPADDGGEPIEGYRVLVGGTEIAGGGSDFLSYFVQTAGTDPLSVTVIARNGRGEGPPAAPATVVPFTRPAPVGGLTAAPGDGAATLSWTPAAAGVRYDYRVDGGTWTDAGAATSVTVSGLSNGSTYQFQVRACAGGTAAPDDACGPPGESVTATPFGPLENPAVSATLTSTFGESVTVRWSIPDGNGRAVTQRSVQITGPVSAAPDPADGAWTGDIGYGETVTVIVRYCVGDAQPANCAEVQVLSPTTATPALLATIALPPLDGTCGSTERYAGAWRTQAECDGGWVVAPTAVEVLCQASGPSYPEVPGDGAATSDQWLLDTDGRWFRATAVDGGRGTIPTCE